MFSFELLAALYSQDHLPGSVGRLESNCRWTFFSRHFGLLRSAYIGAAAESWTRPRCCIEGPSKTE